MNMQALFSRILGFLIIVITLALAPEINAANSVVASGNLTNLIGMSVVTGFGAPLIVLGLLVAGGIFVWKGTQGRSMGDMLKVISLVLVAIIGLTFMNDIVTYTNSLIATSTGFAKTIFGIIPLLIYLGIIAAVGWTGYSAVRGARKGGRRRAGVANY